MTPIITAQLFPKVESHLIELLRSLRPDEWTLPTIAGAWTVRDVAAHLLDTETRRVSMSRATRAAAAPAIRSSDDLSRSSTG